MSTIKLPREIDLSQLPDDTRVALQDYQRAVKETFEQLSARTRPQLSSTLLSEAGSRYPTELGTSVALVEHKLGYKWTGYRVVAQDANAVVYVDTSTTDYDEDKHIPLLASASVNVLLEVF